MFRPKSPQKSLFDIGSLLPQKKLSQLEQTWAGAFREKVLPLIDEYAFRDFYDQRMGAPNKAVQTVIGLLIIKELFDYTDCELLSRLDFDLQTQYALDLNIDEARACQKTLHNFRAKLTVSGKHRQLFENLTAKIAEAVCLSFDKQRLDSTHIISNMAILTRLGLFVKTIEQFLRKLERIDPFLVKGLPQRFGERYLEREGYFADARSSNGRRRLDQCAEDLWYLVDRFRDNKRVSDVKQYRKLRRLLKEQCEISKGTQPKVRLKAAKEVGSDSMQNPSDPDATYGHKGKGYSVQVAETCAGENPFQLITVVEVDGAHTSDQKATVPVVRQLKERKQKPSELYADAGYVSGENIEACAKEGTALKGPLPGQPSSQEKITLAHFTFDDQRQKVICCPADHTPLRQGLGTKGKTFVATFSKTDCMYCPLQAICPTQQLKTTRKLYWTPVKVTSSRRRIEQQSPQFKEQYRIRSGSEATNSELKRAHGAADLRVRGQPAVELAIFFKALACNCKRYLKYIQNQLKQAQNRAREAVFVLFDLKKVKLFLQNCYYFYYIAKMSFGYSKAA